MLFDTHAHLNAEQFDEDRDEVIARAKENGVSTIVNVGFNRETIPTTMELAEKYDFIYAVVGWHPQDAITMKEQDLEWLEELSKHPKVVGLGEMGLDYYWDTSPRDVQAEVFRKQIRLARKLQMPIIIHDRDAHQDIIEILREEKAGEVGGIMHCFSGSYELAKMALDMNFYISFGGPLTFKNAKRPKEVAAKIPLERILIETDCPYLTPHPFRGKRNESAYVKFVAEEMAQIHGLPYEELAKITANNARRLFNIRETVL
ncbi:TatD family hydrolase [Brevibacillus sp. 7WMA2]|uniref:Hydrolase TatD n=3 Tax=Brevibacillus TaxID=55080 RepID=A0A0F6XZE7_BRELA|nr:MULTISPECIES: TatD family hydrolase [Brevibacillus]AIG24477.1 putative deoxyribonuclease YcfH [Brevibacillus laterosporus LMG 15441]AKF93646.1 hydrolase TatD [Brevibacillus laterosporus]AUM63124.1 TatD family deoxyribonuclease [Brevibacillus laterosporus]AYK06151.1 TatD family deoxyribonuclease [Brevibacillus laterosporus]ERM16256.1 hydrolase TatD [Brevibacillus laterosporus PE36]